MTGSLCQDSYIKTESTAFFLLTLSRGSGCVLFWLYVKCWGGILREDRPF
ncbi:hypothetical protein GCWU000342_00494 [Shuttleworthella satelles DSM 14600]|uniref:Uncharacterized protein n=1 Tax=Shuttleworthella satelles DSM 14600 TaxID=626523 RepID=C4G944_9FIRM|nr:hypothetical protein GCWU000342_00494 [Shuttleworthia satelles DSM 14600]